MDKLDFSEYDIPVVKVSDGALVLDFGIEPDELPTAVLFQGPILQNSISAETFSG
jgi:hypothetical protein